MYSISNSASKATRNGKFSGSKHDHISPRPVICVNEIMKLLVPIANSIRIHGIFVSIFATFRTIMLLFVLQNVCDGREINAVKVHEWLMTAGLSFLHRIIIDDKKISLVFQCINNDRHCLSLFSIS